MLSGPSEVVGFNFLRVEQIIVSYRIVYRIVTLFVGNDACPSLINAGRYSVIDCMQRHVYFCQRNTREPIIVISARFRLRTVVVLRRV